MENQAEKRWNKLGMVVLIRSYRICSVGGIIAVGLTAVNHYSSVGSLAFCVVYSSDHHS